MCSSDLVLSCSPESGSENISTDPQLTVRFDAPVTGVSDKYLYVVKAEDGAVAGAVDLGGSQVSCSGSTATITLPFTLENGTEYYTAMLDILSEEKKPPRNDLLISGEKLRKYFPRSYTPQRMEETILKLLDAWMRRRQQER